MANLTLVRLEFDDGTAQTLRGDDAQEWYYTPGSRDCSSLLYFNNDRWERSRVETPVLVSATALYEALKVLASVSKPYIARGEGNMVDAALELYEEQNK